MTPRRRQVLLVALAFLAGTVIGALATAKLLTPTFRSHWFTLVPPPSESSVPSGNSIDVVSRISISYSNAVIAESDIAAPHVTALSGRAKFLSDVSSGDDRSAIGYVISVSADPLDRSQLPEKYKKERIIHAKAGPLTVLPLEEATYEVYFRLGLLDRDGFELLTADSPKHDIQSGKTSQIQAHTDPLVTSRLAAQTDKITLHMVVQKCLSATAE
jgi:hypothetical protein